MAASTASNNNSVSWEVYNLGINFTPLDQTNSLHAANGSLFLATNAQGILKLDNPNGQWTVVLGGHFSHVVSQGNALFAAKSNAPYVYKSVDNGVTWNPLNLGFAISGVYGLDATQNYLLITYYQSGSGIIVKRSTDAGNTWTTATAPPLGSSYSFSRTRVIDDKIFVFYNSTVNPPYTTDGGLTWNTVPNTTGVSGIITDVIHSNGHYIGMNEVILFDYSVQGLASIVQPVEMSKYQRYNDGFFKGGGKLFILGDRLLKADTNLTNFQYCDSGMRAYPHNFIAVHNNKILAQSSDNSYNYSSDFGNSWTIDSIHNEGASAVRLSCITTKDNEIYLGALNSGVYRSTDSGQHYNRINTGIPSYANGTASSYPQTGALHTTAAGNVFMGAGNNLYSLNSDDTSWTLVHSFPAASPPQQYPYITAITSGGPYLFAGTAGGTGGPGEFWRSPDNGASWMNVSIDSAYHYVDDAVIYDGKLYCANSSHGVLRSDDWGDTWYKFDTGMVSIYGSAIWAKSLKAIGGNLYAILNYDQDLYELKAGATSWQNLTSLPTDPQVLSITGMGDTKLFAGSSNSGVWKRSISSNPTSIGWEPAGNHLEALVYPNPGNTLNLTIKDVASLPAMITIYEAASGKTVYSEQMDVPNFSLAPAMASGVYIIDIRGHNGAQSRYKWVKKP